MLGIIHGGGGTGVGSEDVTAKSSQVLLGYTAITSDSNDEPKQGSLKTTGSKYVTAKKNQILKGYTAITSDSNDGIGTGTLDIQSILSFSVAATGIRTIRCSWKNPEKGAFSGVIIVYRTDRRPNSVNDGTRLYKGFGSNNTALGVSTVSLTLPKENTTYYFLAVGYAIRNGSEWISKNIFNTQTIKTSISKYSFDSSGVFVVPENVYKISVFCVGGGGAGGTATPRWRNGGGGGGGFVSTVTEHSVTPGQKIPVTIGAGGIVGQLLDDDSDDGDDSGIGSIRPGLGGNLGELIKPPGPTSSESRYGRGGTTSFGDICVAEGGYGGANGTSTKGGKGGSGGSGGGGGGFTQPGSNDDRGSGGDGGSDGSNGKSGVNTTASGSGVGGDGQNVSTREFSASSGTLYSGGGGGGSTLNWLYGKGGAGGGGRGSGPHISGAANDLSDALPGTNGLGGGGGGGGCRERPGPQQVIWKPANGGSGAVIIKCL